MGVRVFGTAAEGIGNVSQTLLALYGSEIERIEEYSSGRCLFVRTGRATLSL